MQFQVSESARGRYAKRIAVLTALVGLTSALVGAKAARADSIPPLGGTSTTATPSPSQQVDPASSQPSATETVLGRYGNTFQPLSVGEVFATLPTDSSGHCVLDEPVGVSVLGPIGSPSADVQWAVDSGCQLYATNISFAPQALSPQEAAGTRLVHGSAKYTILEQFGVTATEIYESAYFSYDSTLAYPPQGTGYCYNSAFPGWIQEYCEEPSFTAVTTAELDQEGGFINWPTQVEYGQHTTNFITTAGGAGASCYLDFGSIPPIWSFNCVLNPPS